MKDILFDLDGTVTDSGEGITNSVMYALKKMGFPIPPREELYQFIGPPLAAIFSKYCGFSLEEGHRAVEIYREYYSVKGVFQNTVYDGVEDILKSLKEKGARVFLATSKPEFFAKKILAHVGLDQYFDGIVGSEFDGTRVHKGQVINYIKENYGVTHGIMVGDTKYDILGAKEQGLMSIAVLYGYGEREDIELAVPDFIARDTKELKEILLNETE